MPTQALSAIMEEAARRRARILGYMREDPPMPLASIMEREGMTNRSVRMIVKELDAQYNVGYLAQKLRKPADAMTYGLTAATLRLRQKLGDQLYLLRERGNDSEGQGRNNVAPLVGMNNRQQIRAEQRPFNHDWTISQIERLARELGRQPQELIMSCLTS